MIGMGAANVATFHLLRAAGMQPAGVIACDSRGTLHRGRRDVEERQEELVEKWQVCLQTNPAGVAGGIAEAILRGRCLSGILHARSQHHPA